MLCNSLFIFRIGEFHQEFQPAPSFVSGNDNSGEERGQFSHGTDVLHSEFINYIKASWGSTVSNFLTYWVLFGTLDLTLKVSNPSPSIPASCHLPAAYVPSSQFLACLSADMRTWSLPSMPICLCLCMIFFCIQKLLSFPVVSASCKSGNLSEFLWPSHKS